MTTKPLQYYSTYVCYYEGTGITCDISFDTFTEFNGFVKHCEEHIANELRDGETLATIKAELLATVSGLHQEILNYVGNKEYTLKKLKKLWKADFQDNCRCWFVAVSCLIKLRVFKNDDMYGWNCISANEMEVLHMNGMASYENITTHKCQVCRKDAYDKCSKCRTAYYCCGECQNADWKEHKKTCCK